MFRLPVAGVLFVLSGGYMLAEGWLSGGKAPGGAAVAGSLIFIGRRLPRPLRLPRTARPRLTPCPA